MSALTNVFIIDDDQTFVFLTKKIIQTATKNAVNIKEFADGDVAINFLKQHIASPELLPDVVLLDLNMPIMDGWEFLEQYQQYYLQMPKKIKLYIVSSSISPYDIERSHTYSAVTDFITKPLQKERFMEIVESL